MNQDIIEKLHTALFVISPLTEDREEIIAKMGETIWVESLEKILLALPELTRTEVITLLNQDDIDAAVEILSENDVDVDAILKEVATSVMDEVMTQAA